LPAESSAAEIGETGALTSLEQNNQVFSKFSHNSQYHSQVSCAICHRRFTNSPRITFPGKENHSPCIGCHSQQFADNNSPICTICHTNAETGALKPFPPLRSFSVRFNHAKHLRGIDCATCHKPAQGGVAKSIPAGPGTHATCFQCHSAQSRPGMSSCGVCHQPGRKPASPVLWAKAFNVNFSHAKHNSECSVCHTIRAGAIRGNQVTAPLASMHFAPSGRLSCASCHNNKRAFGGNDFSDCKRCHTGKTFKPVRAK
jgi:c(7)-type cytochrome triheme protein